MRNIFVAIILVLIACDWPFNTTITENDIFKLAISHDIQRVMPSAMVILTWSEITVEDFLEIRIEKMFETDTTWTSVIKLSDSFLTSYIDTINDDNDLLYRIGIVDIYEDIVWANGSTSIPPTTKIIVPTEFQTIQSAVNSKLMDTGDTIIVNPDEYFESIVLLDKDILIKSITGPGKTIINRKGAARVVSLAKGIIQGFTITNGATTKAGGGIYLKGDGVIKNCHIINNFADNGGGGLFVQEDGSIINSIIKNNNSSFGKGMYLKDARGTIINNTIINNDIFISGECSELVLRNNIIYNSYPDISFADDSIKTGVTIDYSRFDNDIGFGSNNIFDNPQFVDNLEYLLAPSSPCIDAGHSDEKYLDKDGTRNDMGATGGPGSIN